MWPHDTPLPLRTKETGRQWTIERTFDRGAFIETAGVLPRRTTDMKHLLSGVAVATALMVALPVWAQNPSGGNSVGTPGPNPGGPGLTPYTGGAPPLPPMGPKPSGSNYIPPPEATAPPPEAGASPPNSATPGPHHRHRELSAYHHAKAMRNFHRGMAQKAAERGDTTAQLNREELARIQSGNLNNPPAPSGPPPGAESGPPPAPMQGGPMPGETPPGPMQGH